MQEIPIPVDVINERIQQQTLLCEIRSYLPSHRQFTPLYFPTAFLLDKSSAHPLLQHITEQKTPQSEAEELIHTIAPSQELITPATPTDQSPPAVTPSPIYKNTTSAGSSTSQAAGYPESDTPIAPPSAKCSLDEQFDSESKHQKII